MEMDFNLMATKKVIDMLLNFNIQKILVKNSSQSITTSIFDGSLSQCMHCTDFGLTSILQKTKVSNNDIAYNHFNNYQLERVDTFTYLWFTISINLSLDTEIDRRIDKQPLLLEHVCGKTPRLMFLVQFYTEANSGQHMLFKSVS